MSNTVQTASPSLERDAYETLIINLRNAHALEKQVIAVLESQLKLLDDYPDLHARLSGHILESREQTRRLEAALESCGESPSMVKDALLSVMGMSQSSVQGFADDAVLKAVTADMMTEHLEIATYRSLIALADMAGKPELRPRLEESLQEEKAMAEWFDANLEIITRRFVELKAAERHSREAAATERKAEEAARRETDAPADGTPEMTVWQQLENAKQSRAHPHSNAKPGKASPEDSSSVPDTQTPDRSADPSSEPDKADGSASPATQRPKF